MATVIALKKNSTSGVVPSASSLYQAELAINTADSNIFTKRDDGTVMVQSVGTTQHGSIDYSTIVTDEVVDSFDPTLFRSAKYVVQCTHPVIGFQTIEILVMHDGATAYITRYGLMYSSSELAEFSAEYVSGSPDVVNLIVTTANDSTTVKWTRTVVQA